MPKIDITVSIPPLPEGFAGTPDDLLAFVSENAIFTLDGETPAGQIGGARPTEDVGVWYGDFSIEKFIDGKYRPITDVPIGAMFPWASSSSAPPENYLFCVGQSVLRSDYPELFAVIGTTYGTPESGTTFTLPDTQGRAITGAGIGSYELQGIIGVMAERIVGEYFGLEYAKRVEKHAGSPAAQMKDIATPDIGGTRYLSVVQPSLAMQWIIRYR